MNCANRLLALLLPTTNHRISEPDTMGGVITRLVTWINPIAGVLMNVACGIWQISERRRQERHQQEMNSRAHLWQQVSEGVQKAGHVRTHQNLLAAEAASIPASDFAQADAILARAV
eukprot:TRINITY_DN61477_c0_g1_i1.p1 TRINITY_DN61477_c0_g1~~TRINITY_DN61477_c0_g1_i1.p1  ORF type:complete len:117 (+),score=14.31 TRINITY_DN61477_c0_g1_i1:113-463(+)